ncbi:hypothetical protein COU78_03735 [Candidatus Peregrinibacteria bacterium CG10_big_fil_rev_8_21_14_0_10_49_24]|nr:MAG: hypothetical protein COV83_05555 [Candidatus Peregrinibacteria bacterium CG11_big_fil_rev_8_21_14_0_20_49_14]PIR51229.1 MAG: hypothetical protein COU78_03735 [Candidatus Peregrinibacteria bacterium CG10_big_fil_rev_8_21_14_0_10_49_24]
MRKNLGHIGFGETMSGADRSGESELLLADRNMRAFQLYLREVLLLSPEERQRREASLCEHIDAFLTQHAKRTVCGYIAQNETDRDPLDIEPHLDHLFRNRTGNGLVLPGFQKEEPVFYAIDRQLREEDLQRNAVGALEPKPGTFTAVSPEDIDVFLVPGVEGKKIVYSRNHGYDHWHEEFPHALFLPTCLVYNRDFALVHPKRTYNLIATPDGIIETGSPL